MPSVVKDGSAPESLKGNGEAARKYAVFWHSVTLPFTAAAKSEQLLLTIPCHFPALLKEVSSVFSLPIFPLAGHLDSQSSSLLIQYFLYFRNDMVDRLGSLWHKHLSFGPGDSAPAISPRKKSGPRATRIIVLFHWAKTDTQREGKRGNRGLPFVPVSPHLKAFDEHNAPKEEK